MVPRSLGILAGTVPCQECGGNPKVRLHVANLENVLNLAHSWDFKVGSCCVALSLLQLTTMLCVMCLVVAWW